MSPRAWYVSLLMLLVAVVIAGAWILARHGPPKQDALIPDLSQASPLNQPGGGDVPAEAYEPYSALYRQQPGDEPLVFAADSYADIPQLNGSCLRPSTPEEHGMTDAFAAANRQSRRWQQRFTIPQGYQLLTSADVRDVENCLDTHGADAKRCAKFKNIRHVRLLGIPGFDSIHTHALVSVIREFGTGRGSGGIFEVEKSGGTWQRAEATTFTRDCSWMY